MSEREQGRMGRYDSGPSSRRRQPGRAEFARDWPAVNPEDKCTLGKGEGAGRSTSLGFWLSSAWHCRPV